MGNLIAVWGLAGPVLLLSWAIIRLTPIAMEAISQQLTWYHWLALVVNLLLMGYSEGYRGFQKAYSPRLAARVRHLRDTKSISQKIFAPFFCMGYFHATRRRLITTYVLTLGIVVLVILVHRLSQPWRGILDAGVVFGLGWGLVATLIYCYRALCSPHFGYSPEVP